MTDTEQIPTYESVDAIRRAAIGNGSHFFDADAMRFFGSKVYDDLYAGRIFITSERDRSGGAWNGIRCYTVRMTGPPRDSGEGFRLDTLGSFGQFLTLGTARTAAKRWGRMLEKFGEVHALEAGGINIYPRSERSQFCQRCVCGWESDMLPTPEEARAQGDEHLAPFQP